MIAASSIKSSGRELVAALCVAAMSLTSQPAVAAPANTASPATNAPTPPQTQATTKKKTPLPERGAITTGAAGKSAEKPERSQPPAVAPAEPHAEEHKAPAMPALKIPPFPEPTRRPLSPSPAIDTAKPPPLLPRAPRERMRACAEEWIALKHKSRSGLPMWRDFAVKCLAGPKPSK
jgi:hypothetical protein